MKHRATVEPPNLGLVSDSGTKSVLDQFFRLFKQTSINIYDDLIAAQRDHVLYFGDEATEGTWRIIQSGNNLSFQRLESAAWVEKSAVTP